MAIRVTLDHMLLARRMTLTDLADRIVFDLEHVEASDGHARLTQECNLLRLPRG